MVSWWGVDVSELQFDNAVRCSCCCCSELVHHGAVGTLAPACIFSWTCRERVACFLPFRCCWSMIRSWQVISQRSQRYTLGLGGVPGTSSAGVKASFSGQVVNGVLRWRRAGRVGSSHAGSALPSECLALPGPSSAGSTTEPLGLNKWQELVSDSAVPKESTERERFRAARSNSSNLASRGCSFFISVSRPALRSNLRSCSGLREWPASCIFSRVAIWVSFLRVYRAALATILGVGSLPSDWPHDSFLALAFSMYSSIISSYWLFPMSLSTERFLFRFTEALGACDSRSSFRHSPASSNRNSMSAGRPSTRIPSRFCRMNWVQYAVRAGAS
mmetsp:Transcript_33669/g.44427  ORF Transcript_33669/g.44427 Transcript_33669/m.44427 type:complete len:331 (-) Transcript_33669:1380-2372(-)